MYQNDFNILMKQGLLQGAPSGDKDPQTNPTGIGTVKGKALPDQWWKSVLFYPPYWLKLRLL